MDDIVYGKTRMGMKGINKSREIDFNIKVGVPIIKRYKGVKLNKDKCLFGIQKLTFLGHVFGEEGIKSISETVPPSTVSEVRSFLGMTQWENEKIDVDTEEILEDFLEHLPLLRYIKLQTELSRNQQSP
ncbi:reverse ribonuclease integrase [Plakobranchus ocellatus]|uniref:Reverse ribonuclease integrase n=1 Tax=Plakobranchus ocellatus TaxID=259542 RepID=A0AAV3Z8C6_9GAST|nr:reverse ribonuclease integrase [Plakobranchus ocellatus]